MNTTSRPTKGASQGPLARTVKQESTTFKSNWIHKQTHQASQEPLARTVKEEWTTFNFNWIQQADPPKVHLKSLWLVLYNKNHRLLSLTEYNK